MYPKRDFRRMLAVVAAVDMLREPTLVSISYLTGLDKKTVSGLIDQAIVQAGVVIEKHGPVYKLKSWGPVIKKTGAKLALKGALNAPIMEE